MYSKQDPESIQAMFGSIAKSYDRTNAILSFQMHRWWNRQLVQHVAQQGTLLDLCCGTGEIAFTFLRKAQKPTTAYLLDFCSQMLDCARAKAKPFETHQLHYLQADAQEIPLPAETADCATIAYGIRNVQNPQKCVQDVFRVLKKGGNFGILELTNPTNPFLRFGHQIYLKTCLPLLGRLFASNQEAYDYLQRSIGAFIKPEELEKLLQSAGFVHTARIPLTGGIATIILGQKPL